MSFKKRLSSLKEKIINFNYHDIFIKNLENKQFSFLKKRWQLKIISLVIATFIFFYLQLRNIDKVVLTLPLTVNKNPSQIILNELPKTITVHLTGVKRKIDSININQLKGSINLVKKNSIKKSNGEIKVSPEIINLVEDIKITKIIPKVVEIKISAIAKKWVEVVPKIDGIPNKKYNYVDYSIKPKMVLVSGPKEIIKEISQITTEPISINGISYNQKYTVNITKAVHPKLSLSKNNDYQVVVYVASKEKEIKLFDEEYPINLINFPEDKVILENVPMVKNVVLSIGDKSNLEETKQKIYFYIDLAEKEEEYTIESRKIPNCRIVDFDPKVVKITYKEED